MALGCFVLFRVDLHVESRCFKRSRMCGCGEIHAMDGTRLPSLPIPSSRVVPAHASSFSRMLIEDSPRGESLRTLAGRIASGHRHHTHCTALIRGQVDHSPRGELLGVPRLPPRRYLSSTLAQLELSSRVTNVMHGCAKIQCLIDLRADELRNFDGRILRSPRGDQRPSLLKHRDPVNPPRPPALSIASNSYPFSQLVVN